MPSTRGTVSATASLVRFNMTDCSRKGISTVSAMNLNRFLPGVHVFLPRNDIPVRLGDPLERDTLAGTLRAETKRPASSNLTALIRIKPIEKQESQEKHYEFHHTALRADRSASKPLRTMEA